LRYFAATVSRQPVDERGATSAPGLSPLLPIIIGPAVIKITRRDDEITISYVDFSQTTAWSAQKNAHYCHGAI